MIFQNKEIILKDGRSAFFRSPSEDDAEEMLRFIKKASEETDFLLTSPEELEDFTLEKERTFIRESNENQNAMMIACFVDGRIAGNCQITFRTALKDRHRATIAIALLKEFWNLGIGSKMIDELFSAAGKREGMRQIELDLIEGNNRARGLYEKMGFRITGIKPDAIRMKDGSFVNVYMMMKKL